MQVNLINETKIINFQMSRNILTLINLCHPMSFMKILETRSGYLFYQINF